MKPWLRWEGWHDPLFPLRRLTTRPIAWAVGVAATGANAAGLEKVSAVLSAWSWSWWFKGVPRPAGRGW